MIRIKIFDLIGPVGIILKRFLLRIGSCGRFVCQKVRGLGIPLLFCSKPSPLLLFALATACLMGSLTSNVGNQSYVWIIHQIKSANSAQ